ncbi:bacteriocin immunity protein [Buttiauxella sp. S04-F03]|uniref:bacteriocin immunity protein n=1 Tax=Buttiauxella sp. S04-F03 TaxID=2904525 RepID=UPI001E3B1B05|nr:bacteriocin immunity protein [Buttiauxella sp. S04-F03]MCE0814082.1 bacteriocin immunity protein [Buttiauxella sp. S04-F03]
MELKDSFSEYTEQEFLLFLKEFFKSSRQENLKGEALSDYLTTLSNHFDKVTEHPEKSDLIFYPADNSQCTPEGLLQTVLNWRKSQGLPLFKDSHPRY